MADVKVTVDDRGAKRAMKLLSRPRQVLRVGVLPAEGAVPHPFSSSGKTVGEIAAYHEYGIGVPIRSWLNGWYLEREDEIARQLAADTYRVLFGDTGEPENDEWVALNKRGGVYAQQIQDRIRYGNAFTSNAPGTIKKKGFDLPLIDSEFFIESISHEVD